MIITIIIYPIDSKKIFRNYRSSDVRSYVLTAKESLRVIEGECVVIVNIEKRKYYIHTHPDCNVDIKDLRKTISANIHFFKRKLALGTSVRTLMYKH